MKGREIGNEKLIGILDFRNFTYKNVDARGLITGFQFLQVMICFLKYVQKNNTLCGLSKRKRIRIGKKKACQVLLKVFWMSLLILMVICILV